MPRARLDHQAGEIPLVSRAESCQGVAATFPAFPPGITAHDAGKLVELAEHQQHRDAGRHRVGSTRHTAAV